MRVLTSLLPSPIPQPPPQGLYAVSDIVGISALIPIQVELGSSLCPALMAKEVMAVRDEAGVVAAVSRGSSQAAVM